MKNTGCIFRIVAAMLCVGFIAAFAGDLSASLLANGAPHLALLVGGVLIFTCVRLALWALNIIEGIK